MARSGRWGALCCVAIQGYQCCIGSWRRILGTVARGLLAGSQKPGGSRDSAVSRARAETAVDGCEANILRGSPPSTVMMLE